MLTLFRLQILFVYLAYASDILEILEIFKEKEILEQTELVYGASTRTARC